MVSLRNILGSVVILSACINHAHDKKLAFIDANFDDFVARLSNDEQERGMFKVYYANLVQKIQEAHEKEPEKEKATYRYLYSLALQRLETNHADWYKEIQPFVCDARFTLDEQLDEVRRIIKFFLARYGAYEEFLNIRATQKDGLPGSALAKNQKGIWHAVKEYAHATKNRIAGWFGFGTQTA